jgi:hypothetical protein
MFGQNVTKVLSEQTKKEVKELQENYTKYKFMAFTRLMQFCQQCNCFILSPSLSLLQDVSAPTGHHQVS